MRVEQIKRVVENHNIDIDSKLTLTEICWFVENLLVEEIEYMKETEPQAFVSIADMEKAREVLRDLYHSIDDMDAAELVKAKILDE